jgi:hypothetical protein
VELYVNFPYGVKAWLQVKALCYKQEGNGFETRWRQWMFSIYLILPASLGPEFHSASNRKEYQKEKNNVSGERRGLCVGLTNLPPSVSRLYRQCDILNISQPYRPPRPVSGIALLYGDGVCFLWGTNWTVSTAISSQYLAVNCVPIV